MEMDRDSDNRNRQPHINQSGPQEPLRPQGLIMNGIEEKRAANSDYGSSN